MHNVDDVCSASNMQKIKAPLALFYLYDTHCLSGEIGRHSGLKIRRLPERGRTGSIPVSGTKLASKVV